MKTRLKDVADASGVSVSTVSRVINGDRERPASSETIDKIWSAVKDLGYVPNKSAKSLVKGDEDEGIVAGRIGCIYTSIYDLNNDPFFSCIGLGIQREMSHQNYNIAYTVSAALMDYKELYSYILHHPVDGVIVLGRFEDDIIQMLKNHFKHMVYAGINSVDAGFDEVVCEGYDSAKAAIEHLMERGHTRIGYVGYIPDSTSGDRYMNEHRYTAYCDIMGKFDLDIKPTYTLHTNLKTTTSYENMMAYLDKVTQEDLPTAFFCANDAAAFGVMKALQEKGFHIPKDIAVIGLDNVEMASFVTPKLSSISIPRRELGSRAVKILIEQIETKRDYPVKVNLPFELIIRESSDYQIAK